MVRILVLERRSDVPDPAPFTEGLEFRLSSSIESELRPLFTSHCCVGCADKIGGRPCFLFVWLDEWGGWTTHLMCSHCGLRLRGSVLNGDHL